MLVAPPSDREDQRQARIFQVRSSKYLTTGKFWRCVKFVFEKHTAHASTHAHAHTHTHTNSRAWPIHMIDALKVDSFNTWANCYNLLHVHWLKQHRLSCNYAMVDCSLIDGAVDRYSMSKAGQGRRIALNEKRKADFERAYGVSASFWFCWCCMLQHTYVFKESALEYTRDTCYVYAHACVHTLINTDASFRNDLWLFWVSCNQRLYFVDAYSRIRRHVRVYTEVHAH